MSDVRCRACGAAVPTAAQWCSLCFADLREPVPVPEPVREPVTVPDTPPAPPVAAALTAPAAPTGMLPDPGSAPLVETVPSPAHPPAAGKHAAPVSDIVRWPCPRCGAQVSISLDACDSCGERFLAGATTKAVRVPVLGDVGTLSRTQRLLVGAGIAVAVMVIVILLATLIVKVF